MASSEAECQACAAPSAEEEAAAVRAYASSGGGAGGPTPFAYMHSGLPLNRREVGRAAWGFLHTMAAWFPERPTRRQREGMEAFLGQLGVVYPCGYCADRTDEEIARNPPRASSRGELQRWMCELHNEVNERMGKPEFPCDAESLDRRWRSGPRQ